MEVDMIKGKCLRCEGTGIELVEKHHLDGSSHYNKETCSRCLGDPNFKDARLQFQSDLTDIILLVVKFSRG